MKLFHSFFVIFLLSSFTGQLFTENLSSLISEMSKPATNAAPVVSVINKPTTEQVASDDSVEPKEQVQEVEKGPEIEKNIGAKVDEQEPEKVLPVQKPIGVSAVSKVVAQPIEPKVMPKMAVSPVESEVAASSGVVSDSTESAVSVPVQIVDMHAEVSNELDTLNIDSSGNWLEKRIWYQKAEHLYELIRANVAKAADLRMKFIQEVNHVGHQIDEFYETVNLSKGAIDEMLTAVLQSLENQQAVRGGDLSSSERSLQQKVKDEQIQIETLSKNLQMIEDLDEQIDKTMVRSFKEIDLCRGLETRAWNNFKEIGLELDDKKARVLYYEMENFQKNIEQKINYLQQDLLSYLTNQLIEKVLNLINEIKTSTKSFDAKGLSLQALLEKDEKGDLLILKEREKIKEDQAIKVVEQKLKQKNTPDSWYEKIWSKIVFFFWQIMNKVQEWLYILVCCVKSLFCKIQEWICNILGY